MVEKFYTPEEIAEMFGVTKKTVYDWMREGRLPYIQVGEKTRRISHSDLMEFIGEHRIGKGFSSDEEKIIDAELVSVL